MAIKIYMSQSVKPSSFAVAATSKRAGNSAPCDAGLMKAERGYFRRVPFIFLSESLKFQFTILGLDFHKKLLACETGCCIVLSRVLTDTTNGTAS
jgi:hypothetical protein